MNRTIKNYFFLVILISVFSISCSKNSGDENILPENDSKIIRELKLKLNSTEDKGVIYIQIGDIFYKNRYYDIALSYYEKSIKYLKLKTSALERILNYYAQNNRYDEFEKKILEYEDKIADSDYIGIFLKLSDIYIKKKELMKNATFMEKMLRFHPENMEVFYKLLDAYIALREISQANAMLGKLIKKNIEDPAIIYYQGKIFEITGEYEKAKNFYTRTISSHSANGRFEALAAKGLGIMLLNEKKYTEAKTFFQRASQSNYLKNDDETFYNIGLADYFDFNYGEAIEYFYKSLESNIFNHNARYYIALILMNNLKLYKDASVHLEELLKVYPENTSYLKLLGDCFFILKKYGDCVDVYKNIIELNPMNSDAEEAFLALGSVYKKMNNTEAALQEYKAAINYFPDNWQFYFNAGNIYDDMNMLDEAVAMFTQSIKCRPELSIIYTNLGNVYFKKGEYQKAKNSYEYALQLDKNKDAAYNLSVVNDILKKKDDTDSKSNQ